MRIISLSTIPPRFELIGPALRSLLDQRARVDEIRLYVPLRYRRFPDYDGAAPSVPSGVTIVRTEDDLGPASKVLFAAREMLGTEARILFCDDDKIFHPDWAAALFSAQEERPSECVAMTGQSLKQYGIEHVGTRRPSAQRKVGWMNLDHRARKLAHRIVSALLRTEVARPGRKPIRRAGYVDVLRGFGGAVIRPGFFDAAAFHIPDVLWAVDDVWLSGMMAKNGIPVWVPRGIWQPTHSNAVDVDSLLMSTIEGASRRDANLACVRYMQDTFGIWPEHGPAHATAPSQAADVALPA